MELRILETLLRVLDPRRWRTRLAQAAGLGAAATWVWVRAVQRAPIDGAVKGVRRERRAARIRAENAARERGRLRP